MFIDIHTHHSSNSNRAIYNASLVRTSQLCSYGLHPLYIQENFNEQLEQLEELLADKNCIAVGECGMDKNYPTTLQVQIEVFEKQIAMAEAVKKPMLIHCVKAIQELVLLKRKHQPTQPWIFHGFRKVKAAPQLLKEGFYLSFGTALLKDEGLQNLLCDFPLENLFLETDEGRESIADLYLKVAALKSMEVEELKWALQQNFKKVFQTKMK